MNSKNFWESCIFIYDIGHYFDIASYKNIADNISSKINGDEKILEVACGTGILTKEITKRFNNLDYTAIDYSKNMLKICKKKKINALFKLSDATNLPFSDNAFDVVIIANALHIIPNPSQVLKEIKRCLKDSGTLYASNFLTPIKINEKTALDIMRKFGYTVYNEFDITKFLKLLEENDLHIDKKEIYQHFRTMLFTESSKSNVKKHVLKKDLRS